MRGVLTVAALVFSSVFVFDVAFASGASDEKTLADINGGLEESELALVVSRFDWLRNTFLIESLRDFDAEFLNDCALSLHLAIDYDRGEAGQLVAEKSYNSMLVYKSASMSSFTHTEFEKTVFQTKDYSEFMGDVISNVGKCERAIQPFYEAFHLDTAKKLGKQ